jgi:hypothetical protein
MSRKLLLALCATTICLAAPTSSVEAKVPPDQVAELDGPKLTCTGAERAGSADGVAEFTGKYQGTWPGVKNAYGYEPGPYADEKPMFSITAENMDKYAEKLTEGEKALFKKYPKVYRIDVYPSHRDFKDQDWMCANAKKNAATAEVIHDGLGITGVGGAVPFPIPQNGLEAMWNVAHAGRVFTENGICDIADVYAGGNVAWGRNKFMVYVLNNNPKDPGTYQDPVQARFYTGYLLPERQKGFVAVGYQPNDYSKDATQSWQYLPGTRRVRQAPEVGFDYPVPPAGMRTVDDDYGFNGSPERYTWKIVGKKEFYVPYNNFRINDPAVKYTDLLRTGTINPDYVRYELHRVWVIEGNLKPNVRHIYSKRILYVDEDSWLAVLGDNYDGQGNLWRVPMIIYHYSQEAKTWHRGVSVYHDLTSGAYEAGYMVNERGNDWWRFNLPMTDAMFTPQAAAQGGH